MEGRLGGRLRVRKGRKEDRVVVRRWEGVGIR